MRAKVAIVTGSGRGLGKGIAQAMAGAGAKVVVNERKTEGAHAVAAELTDAGYDAIGIAADVSSSSDVARLFAQTVEHFGTVDILVNNAAITPSSDASRQARAEFLEMVSTPAPKHSLGVTRNMSDDEWARLIDVNLTGSSTACVKR